VYVRHRQFRRTTAVGTSRHDELLHVLDGECELTIRDASGEETRTLRTGDLVIVPRNCWHNNDAPKGVTMLFMTPTEGSKHSWDDPGTSSPPPELPIGAR
jgi:quercetin dioxygenase-like cupin family protein